MTIPWSVFGAGVVLLLFPADRLLSSVVELRSFDCFQTLERSPRYRPWWWVPLLWLDPVRSWAGTWLLLLALPVDALSWSLVPTGPYAWLIAILAVGVLAQTLTRRGDEGVLLAPIGYVAGVVVALTPWPLASISLVAAFLGLFAFRQFYAFFAFGALALPLLGLALEVKMFWLIPAAALLMLPVVAGVCSGCALELPVRNGSGRPSG